MKIAILVTVVFSILLFSIPAAKALDCSRSADSVVDPAAAPGTENKSIPINHIIVLMQENHSFDNYLGALNDPHFYGAEVDGVRPDLSNPDVHGTAVNVYHEPKLCVADPAHNWKAVHTAWDNGKLDGFVKANNGTDDNRVMGYYDAGDLPFYYALANQFAIGDRYFSSVLSQTYPNRFYLITGTSFGHIANTFPDPATDDYTQKTIFDVLTKYNVSWRYYTDSEYGGYLSLFKRMYTRETAAGKIKTLQDYDKDLAAGTLPQVVFIDSAFELGEDEHPQANIQLGQSFVAARMNSLFKSSAWKDSVMFFTYDENGGFFDHVAPPDACDPDGIGPDSTAIPGDFKHYGFRVPLIAVSPYVKHHFVSHKVYDHTSIIKFIETKFNLPALTARDANADGFSDIFDFNNPILKIDPLPAATIDSARACGPTGP